MLLLSDISFIVGTLTGCQKSSTIRHTSVLASTDTLWRPSTGFTCPSVYYSFLVESSIRFIRSVFTWFVLALLGVANYVRIKTGSFGTEGCHQAYVYELALEASTNSTALGKKTCWTFFSNTFGNKIFSVRVLKLFIHHLYAFNLLENNGYGI